MMISNKNEALDIFISSSINQAKSTEEGDYKTGNKNYDRIVVVAKYLKENNYLPDLKELLEHENVGVRIWASTYLLEVSEKEAKKSLLAIQKMNIPHHSFTAEMTLEEWNSGNLTLQF